MWQGSKTKQHADSDAKAKQDAINADVPLTLIFGRKEHGKKQAV